MDQKTIKIVSWLTEAVLFEAAVDTVKEAVELAVRQGVNLAYARLDGASLDGASLDGARLDGASLDGARLVRASLVRACLDGASLVRARLPAPTSILLASWGEVSTQLCADLMLWDASNHPEPAKFDAWAKGGECPYSGVLVSRAANFSESRKLWGQGVACRPYDLMTRLLAEKCPAWTGEDRARFAASFELAKKLKVGDFVIPAAFVGGPGCNDEMRAMAGAKIQVEGIGIHVRAGGWYWPMYALTLVEE